MVKTPTWHVFNLYKVHQDNELVESILLGNSKVGTEKHQAQKITESVSADQNGKIYVTLTNASLDEEEDMTLTFAESKVKSAVAQIVTGKMDAHNTFKAPNKVVGEAFDVKACKDGVDFLLPPRSVVKLEIALK